MKLTSEQRAAVEAAAAGESLKVAAVAGAGKTLTLVEAAKAAPGRRKVYLVFNRSMAEAARARLPEDVQIFTLNAYAWRQVVANTPYRAKWRGGHVGVRTLVRRWGEVVRPYAAGALRTLERFFQSADLEPGPQHLPEDLDPEDREETLVLAEAVWAAMRDPADDFPLTHGAYLKLWQLEGAPIAADLLLVDEAQDLNPVLVEKLRAFEGQLLLVGDPFQQIYGWRGAVNAMEAFALPEVRLSRSFRFGPAVAEVAEAVLRHGGFRVRIEGAGRSRVNRWWGAAKPPVTVLTRTNLGLVEEALKLAGRPLHLVGRDWREAAVLLREINRIRAGEGSEHPLLSKHGSWRDLEGAARHGRRWLLPYLELAERWGKRLGPQLQLLAESRVEPQRAEYTLATVHQAKGEEWPRVRLGGDLRLPSPKAIRRGDAAAREELNALYVAVTRPREQLDLTRGQVKGL